MGPIRRGASRQAGFFTPLQYRDREISYLPGLWDNSTSPTVYYPWDPVQLGGEITGIQYRLALEDVTGH